MKIYFFEKGNYYIGDNLPDTLKQQAQEFEIENIPENTKPVLENGEVIFVEVNEDAETRM